MDAELHERDRRRAHELDQLNNQLARTIASLQQRQAVQEAFTNLTIKGSDEQELAAALGELTGRTVVVRDAFGHETTRVVGADQATGPSPSMTQTARRRSSAAAPASPPSAAGGI